MTMTKLTGSTLDLKRASRRLAKIRRAIAAARKLGA
ncbi:hypothetical protein ABIE64_002360 [Thalassospira sp. MBR-102]|jgi:hypothetical protein|nr:hypothetical protein KO164_0356 [Thalassospira sp. KO164]PXX34648.1 hypothetical protein C7967_102711 [Thalassospira sp. 11-3]SED57580.1 hypothetical protein SAMN04515623_0354 [Thalassospira permensis]